MSQIRQKLVVMSETETSRWVTRCLQECQIGSEDHFPRYRLRIGRRHRGRRTGVGLSCHRVCSPRMRPSQELRCHRVLSKCTPSNVSRLSIFSCLIPTSDMNNTSTSYGLMFSSPLIPSRIVLPSIVVAANSRMTPMTGAVLRSRGKCRDFLPSLKSGRFSCPIIRSLWQTRSTSEVNFLPSGIFTGHMTKKETTTKTGRIT